MHDAIQPRGYPLGWQDIARRQGIASQPHLFYEGLMGSRRYTLTSACLFAEMFASAGTAKPWCTVPVAQAHIVLATKPFDLPPADAAPHPLANVHTGGMPHRGRWDEVHSAMRDLVLMQRAALAWRAGAGQTQYDVAVRLMVAWVETYQPTLDPIDETSFDMLIDTFAIVRDRLAPADRIRIADRLGKWGWAYVDSIARLALPDHSIWINNWQSHRIKLVTMLAVAANDKRLFGEARRLFRLQIAANIHPDGETLDFAVRDALHYVVYDLEPLLQAALAARTFAGEDWYRWETEDQASLAGAVTWLMPYAAGQATHEEFVHSQVDFDAERAAAGVKGYKGLFDVQDAASLYWLAARFDSSLESLARSLGPEPDQLAMCGN